jgi:hypothetical protein
MRSPRLREKLIYLRDSLGTFFVIPDFFLYSHRTELVRGLGSGWPRIVAAPRAVTHTGRADGATAPGRATASRRVPALGHSTAGGRTPGPLHGEEGGGAR